MALTLTWHARNRDLQADVAVDHFAGPVAAPDGWQCVVEWRFRDDPGDPWGAPTTHIVTPPTFSATYTPPGDGWVQITVYSTQAGRVSWQGYVWVVPVEGGEVLDPQTYVDEADEPYSDEDNEPYTDA